MVWFRNKYMLYKQNNEYLYTELSSPFKNDKQYLSQNLFFIVNQRDKWRSLKRWHIGLNILETTLGRKSFVKNFDTYLHTVTLLFLQLLLLLFFFLS